MNKKKLIENLTIDMAKSCFSKPVSSCAGKSCFMCLATFLIELGYRKEKRYNVSKSRTSKPKCTTLSESQVNGGSPM